MRGALTRKVLLSTVGLFGLALLAPRLVQAQAEELPAAALPADRPGADRMVAEPEPALPLPPPPAQAKPADRSADSVPESTERPRGLVLMPSLGLTLPVGSTLVHYSAGLRFDLLAGWMLTPTLSLNGEVGLDFMSADTDPHFWSTRENFIEIAVSPLWHARAGQLVVGPKLGWFHNRRNAPDITWQGRGFSFGINAGLFLPVGSVHIGGLLSATVRTSTTFTCQDPDVTTGAGCDYHRDLAPSMGLTAAALF
jgi:hypothetical protein